MGRHLKVSKEVFINTYSRLNSLFEVANELSISYVTAYMYMRSYNLIPKSKATKAINPKDMEIFLMCWQIPIIKMCQVFNQDRTVIYAAIRRVIKNIEWEKEGLPKPFGNQEIRIAAYIYSGKTPNERLRKLAIPSKIITDTKIPEDAVMNYCQRHFDRDEVEVIPPTELEKTAMNEHSGETPQDRIYRELNSWEKLAIEKGKRMHQ